MYKDVALPRRPHIPLSFHALLVCLTVGRCVLHIGTPLPSQMLGLLVVLFGACAALCLAVVALLRRRALAPLLATLAATAFAAFCTTSLLVGRMDAAAGALCGTPLSSCRLHLTSDLTERDGKYRGTAEVLGEGLPICRVWVTLPVSCERGSAVTCVGQFAPNADDDWGRSSRMQGICGSVQAKHVVSCEGPTGTEGVAMRLRQAVCDVICPESSAERALLAGCVCASRQALRDYGVDQLFSACGAAHLVAVSGGHLSILMTLVAALCRRLRIRPAHRAAATLGACGVFVACCGLPVSAVRAWLMLAASQTGALLGRRSHGLSSVSVTALAMALADPALVGQTSYLLSVASVCGLCLLSPYAAYVMHVLMGRLAFPRWVPHKVRMRLAGVWQSCAESLGASVTAMVVTLPICAGTFGEVSLIGPLANLLIAMPFTAFVGLGIVACCLSWAPALASAVLLGCDSIACCLLWLMGMLARIPGVMLRLPEDPTAITVAVALAVVALAVAWPPVSRRVLGVSLLVASAVVCCLLVRWRYFAPPRICVLDVGQGDAILVQDGAAAVLVDAGPDDALCAALARCHVSHVDAVVVTHLHDDHYGGLQHLHGTATCAQVLVAQGVASNMDGSLRSMFAESSELPLRELSYGDVVHVGDFSLRVVWPRQAVDGSQNADSIELLVTYQRDGRSLVALLTGDAEQDETGAVIEHGDVGDIDVLKVGHHGSEVSIASDQAQALDPEVAIASAGAGNRYGHPTQACILTLEDAGALFLCTKDVGDVEIRPGDRGPVVL